MISGCFLTWEDERKNRFGEKDNEFGCGHVDFEVHTAHLGGAAH